MDYRPPSPSPSSRLCNSPWESPVTRKSQQTTTRKTSLWTGRVVSSVDRTPPTSAPVGRITQSEGVDPSPRGSSVSLPLDTSVLGPVLLGCPGPRTMFKKRSRYCRRYHRTQNRVSRSMKDEHLLSHRWWKKKKNLSLNIHTNIRVEQIYRKNYQLYF